MRYTDEENTNVKSIYNKNKISVIQKDNTVAQMEIKQAVLIQIETKNKEEHNTPSISRNDHLLQYTGFVNGTRPEYYQPHLNNSHP